MIDEGCCRLFRGRLIAALPGKRHVLTLIEARVRAVLRACIFGDSPWPLLFYGEPGSGKTCAALCMHDYAGGLFTTVEDFCEFMRLALCGNAFWCAGYPKTVNEIWSEWAGANLCTLDELATRDKVSDHQYSTLKRAIDLRENKPLIVISNHNLEAISRIYDARIASRLCCGTLIPMDGDRRLARKRSRQQAEAAPAVKECK